MRVSITEEWKKEILVQIRLVIPRFRFVTLKVNRKDNRAGGWRGRWAWIGETVFSELETREREREKKKVFSKKTKKCVESMKAERLANLMNGRVMWMKLQWPSFVDRPLAPSLLRSPSPPPLFPANHPRAHSHHRAVRGRYVRDRLSTAPPRILIRDIDWKFGR